MSFNNRLLYSIFALVALTSCAEVEITTYQAIQTADGVKAVPVERTRVRALMAKQAAEEIPTHRGSPIRGLVQNATEVPIKAIDGAVILGSASIAGNVAKAASADKTREAIGAQKASVATEGIRAQAATTSEAVKAGAEVSPITINAP